NEPIEQELWTEGVTVPMIVMTPFTVRSNRWDMALSTAILETDKDTSAVGPLIAYEPDHPIFTSVLNENNEALIFDEEALGTDDSIDFLNDFDDGGMLGNGTVLAIESAFEVPWIVYWESGQEFYDGSLYQAGGPRLYYSIGSDDDPNTWGEKNTLPAGDQILLNAIAWMTGEDINQGVVGDFNGNGSLDIEDINQLTAASAAASGDGKFDLNSDSAVNGADVTVWIKDLKNSWIGDANLDGEFNSGDFVVVFGAGKFEQEVDAVWADGDWNGDGRFNSGDFVAAFTDGGYELGPRTGVSAVPEPSSSGLILVGIFGLLSVRRRRS
ncbi:MAG: PEP-CTERM sorting domain-containing protein, partial [Planctomycetales bacterium]|nr:PEP-CTERM sorting domain-containing protein [Planctomycetales bacterium]